MRTIVASSAGPLPAPDHSGRDDAQYALVLGEIVDLETPYSSTASRLTRQGRCGWPEP